MGAHKYKIDYGNTDIFKYYKKKTGNPHKITQKKYFDIVNGKDADYEKHLTYIN